MSDFKNLKDIAFFILLLTLLNLHSISSSPNEPQISGNILNQNYIGKELEFCSENQIFELLNQNWELDPAFRSVIMSGQLSLDPDIEVVIEHTETGYRIEMKNLLSDKTTTIQWGIEDIVLHQSSLNFKRSEQEVPSLDFTGHAQWIRFSLENPGDTVLDLILELDKHMYSWFDLYYPKEKGYSKFNGAFEQRMSERIVKDSRIAFPIRLSPGSSQFFIRVDSKLIDTVPIRLWTEDEYLHHISTSMFIHGCISGATILLLIYSLFLTFSMRERGYLYLALLISTGFIVHLSSSGLGFTLLWPENPEMIMFFLYIMYPATIVVNLSFCRYYLNTKYYAPLINTTINIMIIIAVLIIIVQLSIPMNSRILFFGFSLGLDYLSVIPLMYAAIISLKSGKKQAVYIITAICFQIVSYLEYWLSFYNIIPLVNIDFLHIRSIGFVLIMLWGVRANIRYMESKLHNMRNKLNEIISANSPINKTKTVTDKTQIKVEAVKVLIQSHYKEHLYRNDLAASVEMSGDHLGRMFKYLTGEKISDYINQLRIKEACRLLESNNDKIINIAFYVGFESLRTFNKCFLNSIRMPPNEYRKKFFGNNRIETSD